VDKIDVQTLLNAAGLTIEQKASWGVERNVNITGLPMPRAATLVSISPMPLCSINR
jgi:hypothetical protein